MLEEYAKDNYYARSLLSVAIIASENGTLM